MRAKESKRRRSFVKRKVVTDRELLLRVMERERETLSERERDGEREKERERK